MKKAKLITSLSSIAFVGTVAPIASTAFTTSKNSTTVKTNSLTAANAKSLDDLGWIKRSQTTSNNTSTIRAEIVSDNNIIFTKYRDLKKNITITVTETSTKNVFLASITSLDQSKYSGGPVTWNITYLPPEPEPEPPAYNAVTYDELVALKEAGELIAGAQYRIVDYQCTCNGTVNGVADVAQATNHPFDICVTATGAKTLNENAMAIKNAADESSTGTKYFTNNDLDAWEIKYCLDNDTSRFEWASSSGKGVVYYMKDEFGNEASYDFKNIQFKRYMITGVADPTVTADGLVDGYFSPTTSRSDYNVSDTDYIWTYTFGNYSKANPADLSLDKSNNIYNNVIKET